MRSRTCGTSGATRTKRNAALPGGFYDWPFERQERWVEKFIADVWKARQAKAHMLNVIIDLSHNNGPIDFGRAKGAGILGVIHKATQGLSFVDHQYTLRGRLAAQWGLLWGAYHFGDSTDGAQQAAHFIANVNPDPGALLVLDIEENPVGPSMTLDQAHDFVNTVYGKTGRWPGIYGGFYLRQLLAGQSDPVFQNCWLWISDYRQNPQPEIPAAWQDWKLWQYTDSKNGNPPHDLAGIYEDDRSIFNGDNGGQLGAFWRGDQ